MQHHTKLTEYAFNELSALHEYTDSEYAAQILISVTRLILFKRHLHMMNQHDAQESLWSDDLYD